jgi:predicted amidophosphoribosyltransferase
MDKTKAVIPTVETEYAQPMVYMPCYCPSCGSEVPYTKYCCECGQKFKVPKIRVEDY